jgi:hypothetical protein
VFLTRSSCFFKESDENPTESQYQPNTDLVYLWRSLPLLLTGTAQENGQIAKELYSVKNRQRDLKDSNDGPSFCHSQVMSCDFHAHGIAMDMDGLKLERSMRGRWD